MMTKFGQRWRTGARLTFLWPCSASEPCRTFYRILAETGIRGGEICGLRIEDLDLDHGVIHVRQSVWRGQLQTVKSRRGNRRFPVSSELVEHLRVFLRSWRPNALGLLAPRLCSLHGRARPGTRV
jgi:integrase